VPTRVAVWSGDADVSWLAPTTVSVNEVAVEHAVSVAAPPSQAVSCALRSRPVTMTSLSAVVDGEAQVSRWSSTRPGTLAGRTTQLVYVALIGAVGAGVAASAPASNVVPRN